MVPVRCCGDRSPGAFWPPAPLESVDGWLLAIPDARFLEEAALWYPPFAGVVPRGPAPPPEGRMPQPPAAREGGRRDPCVRTGAEGLSGGNWMVVRDSPGTPGKPLRPDASLRPFLVSNFCPFGGCGPGRTPSGG